MSRHNTPPPQTTLITARVDDAQIEQLNHLSKKYAIGRSRLLREALKRYLILCDQDPDNVISPTSTDEG